MWDLYLSSGLVPFQIFTKSPFLDERTDSSLVGAVSIVIALVALPHPGPFCALSTYISPSFPKHNQTNRWSFLSLFVTYTTIVGLCRHDLLFPVVGFANSRCRVLEKNTNTHTYSIIAAAVVVVVTVGRSIDRSCIQSSTHSFSE